MSERQRALKKDFVHGQIVHRHFFNKIYSSVDIHLLAEPHYNGLMFDALSSLQCPDRINLSVKTNPIDTSMSYHRHLACNIFFIFCIGNDHINPGGDHFSPVIFSIPESLPAALRNKFRYQGAAHRKNFYRAIGGQILNC